MIAKLTLNSKVALLLIFLSIIGFIATFTMDLDARVLFIPRVAIALIGLGGVLVFLKDKSESVKSIILDRTNMWPYIAGVIFVIWLYSWAFRNIGLATSTFVFLFAWWTWIAYRDTQIAGDPKLFLPKLIFAFVLAVGVTGAVYLLFEVLLGIHLPGTPLP